MRWKWNRIGVTLPDEWEMLQFSRAPSEGRCVFADRYQYRMELDWTLVAAPPDMERMSSDYLAKLREDGLESVQKASHHPWSGASGVENGRPVTRYGAYFPEGPFMLEAVFIGEKGGKADFAADGRILDTIKVAPHSGSDEWSAFGMSWSASARSFDSCTVAPALVEATFTGGNGRESQTFSRRGMLKTWLRTSVVEWLAAEMPDDYGTISQEHAERDGHDVWTIVARRRHDALADWLHGRRHIRASAWICPKDGRLYCMSTLAHCDGTHFPHASLGCCEFRQDNTAH